MRKIITIGESLLDIIFKNKKPIKATPGGSMLNTSISLGRLYLPVHFVTEVGEDLAGTLIKKFLSKNHVCMDYIRTYKDGKTVIALAFLDEENRAEYDFYKLYPSQRLLGSFPKVRKDDIFLFGSFFAIEKEIRNTLIKFIKSAQSHAVTVYDPNFRKAHLEELAELRPLIDENINLSDIVKGSEEDFQLIFNSNSVEEIYSIIKSLGCSHLIYTQGPKDVILMSEKYRQAYSIPSITPKSTIGGGDAFNAGLLYGLFKNHATKDLGILSSRAWDSIFQTAIDFARSVCLSYDNYIDSEYAKKLRFS